MMMMMMIMMMMMMSCDLMSWDINADVALLEEECSCIHVFIILLQATETDETIPGDESGVRSFECAHGSSR